MIYVKTAAGRQALKERAETMPRKYHFPFLMCDGVRDSADILAASVQHGFTSVDLYQMVQLGFVEPAQKNAVPVPQAPTVFAAAQSSSPNANAMIEAHHLATAMTAKLGLRGFRLNMAVETASSLQDFRALLPKIEEAVGMATAKPLADLLKNAGV
jgi:hypothetical protein